MNPEHHKANHLFSIYAAKLYKWEVPPNLARNLEAKIDSQKYEIHSLQKDLQTTRSIVGTTSIVICQQHYGTSHQSSNTGWE